LGAQNKDIGITSQTLLTGDKRNEFLGFLSNIIAKGAYAFSLAGLDSKAVIDGSLSPLLLFVP